MVGHPGWRKNMSCDGIDKMILYITLGFIIEEIKVEVSHYTNYFILSIIRLSENMT